MKVTQSYPTLCIDPMDYTVHGILQAEILKWVAFPFSRGSSNPGIKPRSLALQGDSLLSESLGKPLAVLLKQLDAVLNGKWSLEGTRVHYNLTAQQALPTSRSLTVWLTLRPV